MQEASLPQAIPEIKSGHKKGIYSQHSLELGLFFVRGRYLCLTDESDCLNTPATHLVSSF